MKPLILLAAGLVACVSGAGGVTDGPPGEVADGSLTSGEDGASMVVVDGGSLADAVDDASSDVAGDGSPGDLADGAAPGDAADDVSSNDVAADVSAGDLTGDATLIDLAQGPRTDVAAPALTNVALKGRVTASSVWQNDPRFQPENVIDDSTYDDVSTRNYWLLPNVTAGWWEVDLGAEFKIRRINVLNCNNDQANDRGTKDFRLEIRSAAQQVVLTAPGILPFTSLSSPSQPTEPRVMEFEEAVQGRYVRIYVDTWYPTRTDPTWPHPTVPSGDPGNQGGGLNEVQVFALPALIP